MLKTKLTFSGEKVKIFETPPSNLETVNPWEDDDMKSLLSWESAYQKPQGTWSQISFCLKFQSLLSFWRVWGREVKVDTKKVFASLDVVSNFEIISNEKWSVSAFAIVIASVSATVSAHKWTNIPCASFQIGRGELIATVVYHQSAFFSLWMQLVFLVFGFSLIRH